MNLLNFTTDFFGCNSADPIRYVLSHCSYLIHRDSEHHYDLSPYSLHLLLLVQKVRDIELSDIIGPWDMAQVKRHEHLD